MNADGLTEMMRDALLPIVTVLSVESATDLEEEENCDVARICNVPTMLVLPFILIMNDDDCDVNGMIIVPLLIRLPNTENGPLSTTRLVSNETMMLVGTVVVVDPADANMDVDVPLTGKPHDALIKVTPNPSHGLPVMALAQNPDTLDDDDVFIGNSPYMLDEDCD